MGWRYKKRGYDGYGFRPYVPVAERKAQASAQLKKLEKKGMTLQPVLLQDKKIASSFWGKAWCDNLESYMDYANRLPRGRTYVRNGSVLHLEIKDGAIEAQVAGSSLYRVKIEIAPAPAPKWKALCKECAGQIGSLIELLSGQFSDRVMGVMTRPESGLFPSPKEIKLHCSCPDWATMCKHVAATLYGVGARLDLQPELLFLLRSVDQSQLVAHAVESDIAAGSAVGDVSTLDASDLSDVFGIEIESVSPPPPSAKSVKKKAAVRKKKPAVRKKAAKPLPPPAKKRGRPKGAKKKSGAARHEAGIC